MIIRVYIVYFRIREINRGAHHVNQITKYMFWSLETDYLADIIWQPEPTKACKVHHLIAPQPLSLLNTNLPLACQACTKKPLMPPLPAYKTTVATFSGSFKNPRKVEAPTDINEQLFFRASQPRTQLHSRFW